MEKDLELRAICSNADLILADGQIPVILSKWLKLPIRERVCMTDFVWRIFELSVEKGYRLFLLGGKEEILATAVDNIQNMYPQIKIADYFAPLLGFETSELQVDEVNRRIFDSKSDILIVFLGCPKQEKFIYSNKDKYCVPISIAMGGCVDFIAGIVKRAPLWMQKAGLEWFFRFCQEPTRMFKRYFIEDIKIFNMALRSKLLTSKCFRQIK
jgi:N-acetylglucosaminyldiphosphoundecaprenol N-acetyl-beta-D-mannosaminyltransferase